jgi:hypothetical protein
MDGSTPQKNSRVLRAADVMPPFKYDNASCDNQRNRDPIPTFDLAESILAEQRRLATGKRKRSSRSREVPTTAVREESVAGGVFQERSSVDLAALHQIVAGIVSRDIERLCTGPAVALQ